MNHVGGSHLSLQSLLRLATSTPVLLGSSADMKPVLVVLTVAIPWAPLLLLVHTNERQA